MIINYYNPLPFLPRWLWPDENSALDTVIYPRESPAGFNTCGLRGALTCGGDIPHPRPSKIPFSPPSHSFSPFSLSPGLSCSLCSAAFAFSPLLWRLLGFFLCPPSFSPLSFLPFRVLLLLALPSPGSPAEPVPCALGRERSLSLPPTPLILLPFGAGGCQPQELLTHISPQILTRLPTPRSPSLPSAPCHLPRCSVEAKPP